MNELAPIVLFVYNRLDHTTQTIEALQKNYLAKDSTLYVYSDASKNKDGEKAVEKVREYVHTISGFKEIHIIERKENYGLAKSIIDGVTNVVNKYGKIIVLEDDLVTSPYFLTYMNKSLEKYNKNKNVFSITGYSWTDNEEKISDTYFLKLTSSWSWATWADRWIYFANSHTKLKNSLKERGFSYKFNYGNSYNYTEIAKLQLKNKLDSWAIFWYFSVYQQEGLTLYPAKKLVKNIGHDGSGTHCNATKIENLISQEEPILTEKISEIQNIKEIVQKILKNETSKRNKINIRNKIKEISIKHLSTSFISRLLQFKNSFLLFLKKKCYKKNTYVDKSVHILGVNHVSIGSNSIISEDTWFNVNVKEYDYKHILVGNNCYIGKRNFFSSGRQIFISDYCMTGIDCKIMGSDHVLENPLQPYISTGTTFENIIRLGVNVWLGASVSIIGNVHIGHGSIIGANSVVTKDIPPFSIAVGLPAKVIKRYDFSINKWVKSENYDINNNCLIPNEDEYLKILTQNVPKIFLPLQASSKRFGNIL